MANYDIKENHMNVFGVTFVSPLIQIKETRNLANILFHD